MNTTYFERVSVENELTFLALKAETIGQVCRPTMTSQKELKQRYLAWLLSNSYLQSKTFVD
ncbi:hypothetical protein GCM10007895_00170 [Paraferrimonas sedimenticola]|uniref:Uncharacterized protein n=1 Tax=Paraferrimonas sedimenticola TaxID=375674 RepID=A0AA37RNM2_9GAMM|nr:hypothetical protein GCM10007895_00170 [Paraferrimonas sedimenticola]